MNAEDKSRRLRSPAGAVALAVIALVAVGVVGGHYIWTSSGGSNGSQSASRRFGPFRSTLPGGFKETCNSKGCSFSFGSGSNPGSGSFPGGGFFGGNGGNGGGNGGSGGVSSSITGKIDPGVVDINTDLGYDQGSRAAGTGMVVTSNGEVITNNHVIIGATSITATDVGNGRTYTARVLGYDHTRDIAVLQLEGASGLKTVSLGDSGTVKVGDTIATIGNAGGTGGTPSAASGRVSAVGRSITAGDELTGENEHLHGLIELNGGLEPGDSGGPLVNSSGQVVGMDTAASSTFVFNNATDGFAIPIDEVKTVAADIVAGNAQGAIHVGETGFLGVTVNTNANVTGALIQSVVSGTPAAGTALAADDVITAVDGQAVSSPLSLTDAILRHQPGDTITISWRTPSGSTASAKVKLASGPPQ